MTGESTRERKRRRARRGGALSLPALLGAAWLILPAAQYFGAWLRAQAAAELREATGPLATLDLTPWYVALLGATAAFALTRAMAVRRPVASVSENPS